MKRKVLWAGLICAALLACILIACSKSKDSNDDMLPPIDIQEEITNAETKDGTGSSSNQSAGHASPENEDFADYSGTGDEEVAPATDSEISENPVQEPITASDEGDAEGDVQVFDNGDILLPALP